MRLTKLTLTLCACAAAAVAAPAQDYLTNALGGSLAVYRDPARQASTEVDAAINNPAGTAFAKPGLSLSGAMSSDVAFERAKVTGNELLNCKDSRYTLGPAFQAVYRKGAVAFSMSFAREGGYGHRKLDGSPYLALTSGDYTEINRMLRDANTAAMQYLPYYDKLLDDRIVNNIYTSTTTLYNWGLRVGAAVRLARPLSVYAGIKVNRVTNAWTYSHMAFVETEGDRLLGWDTYISGRVYNIMGSEPDPEWGILPIPEEEMQTLCQNYMDIPVPMPDERVLVKGSSGAWRLAPVLGLDINAGSVNFGARYEFASTGHKDSWRLPSSLSAGFRCDAAPSWRVSAGTDVFFKNKHSFAGIESPMAYNIAASLTYLYRQDWEVTGGLVLSHTNFLLPEVRNIPVAQSVNVPYLSLGLLYNFNKYTQFSGGIRTALTSSHLHSPGDIVRYSVSQPVQFAFGINLFFNGI